MALTPLSFFFTQCDHIWRNDWLLCVNYKKGLRFDHGCDLGVKGQGQIYLKSKSYGSYLALWLPVVCRLQQSFKITDMAFESKIKVKCT